jgi:hypothetical protein
MTKYNKQGNPKGERNGLGLVHNGRSCLEVWAWYQQLCPEAATMTFQQAVDSGWFINTIKKASEELQRRNREGR